MGLFKRIKQRKQSQKENANRNIPYMMEMLEPRIMLSADLTITDVAGVLSSGLGQFDSQVDNFIDVGEHPELETRLPLVIRNEGTDILDYHSVAPKIMEILSVDVDINGDGLIGTPGGDPPGVTVPTTIKNAEDELHGLDTSADDKVDFLEFLQGGFFDEISTYLGGSPTNGGFVTALEGLDISAGLSSGQSYDSGNLYAPARWIDLVVSSVSDTSTTNQVSFEMDVSLTFRNELALDLGTVAEDLGITLPGLFLDVDANLDFTIEVGVLTSGETPTSDDFFLDFTQLSGDDITLTVDGSTTFASTEDVDIGFLGVEVKTGGSVTLTANLSGNIADPTTPTTLGFSTSQFPQTSATGTITADAIPSAYDLTDDAEFILRIGNSDAITVTVGDVLTNGNGSITDLVTDVDTAVGNALLGSVITVDSTATDATGKLILSVVDFDATKFGFSSNDQSGTTLTGSPVMTPSGNMSFLISVDHDIPVLISVSSVASLADLKTKLGSTETSGSALSGTGITAAWIGAGNNELQLTTAGSKHLEISDNLTFNSTLSHSDLGASASDLMPTFNTSGTFGVNLPIQVKSGLNGLTLPTDAAIILSAPPYTPPYDPFVVTPLPADADGNIRFDFGIDITGTGVDAAMREDIFNFVNISASDVVGLVRRLGSWLDQARQTDSFSSIEIPLSGADLSDFLDFENIVDDLLLTAGQLITDENAPDFSTAQELVAKLAASTATYNPSTDELTYVVSLTHTLDPLSVPIDFDLDFSPLLEISSNSEVRLTADGTLAATFGFFLGDLGGASLTDTTTLDSLGIDMDEIEAGPAITAENAPRIIYGRLTADAHFGLLVSGYTANQHTFDGATDVDDSTDEITVGSHGMSTGDVVIYSKGADVNTAVGGLSDNGTYFVIEGATTTTVKLARSAEDAAADIAIDLTDGTNAGHFLLEAVTVTAASTEDNITMANLVTDINNAIAAAAVKTPGLDSEVVAESPTTAHRVALKDLSGTGGFTLYATSTNSAVRELGFTSIQDAVLGGIPSELRVIGTKDVPRLVGQLTGDTTFEIIIGTKHYPITIEAGEADGNRTIIDLINDLNKAIETPSLVSGAVTVTQLTSDAHLSISINGGMAVPITVLANSTDGTAFFAFDFDGSTTIDTVEDTISFGSAHKFITGDEVVYTNDGGTSIGGLTDSTTYYVIVEDSTTIKLAESEDDANSNLAIVLLAVGAGLNHRLTHTANDDFEDLIDDINRALIGTSLDGLIRAEDYERPTDTHHIRLKAVDDSVVKFELAVTGTDPAVTVLGLPNLIPETHLYKNLSDTIEVLSQGDHIVLRAYSDELTFDGATDVNTGDETITINNHGLVTGRTITYSSSGTPISTLSEGGTYNVIVVDGDTVKLATSEANAFAGTQIDLTAVGSSGDHKLTAVSISAFDVDGSSASDLGFGASQTANHDDLIIRLSNNTSTTVSLDGTTILDIIDDIHQATDGTLSGGHYLGDGDVLVEIDPDEGTGLRLKDNTFSGTAIDPIFRVEPTNASPAAIKLRILAMDPGGDLDDDGFVNAADGDSYIDGGPLTGADLADRFFIENGQLSASFALDTPSINFSSLDTHASDHKKVVHTDFDPTYIGMYLDIAGGTNFTPGRYKIVDVQGNEAELDANAWTSSGGTDGTGNIKGIQASASFGFVGIDLIGSGSLTGTVSAGLNGGARTYLSDLVEDLGAAADFVDTPTFSGSGTFVLDVIVTPDFLSLLSSGTPQITINVNSIGDAFTITEFSDISTPAPTWVDADTFSLTGNYESTFKKGLVIDIDLGSTVVSAEILGSTYTTGTNLTTVDLVSGILSGGSIDKVFAPTPPDISLTFADLDDLVDFDDIGFSNILDAISGLVDFLSGIEGLEFFDLEIPLIGKSVSDLLSLADKFTTALDEITSDPAGTIQLVEAKLKNALGLPMSSPSILSLDGVLLKFNLDLVASFNESLSVEIPEFLGFDLSSLGLGLSGPIGLGGSADLNANGSLTASLDFGIDLGVSDIEDLGDIYIYDTTGVDAAINASGENLSFSASLGPFGLFIQNHPDYDSEISINGTFSAGIKASANPGDNKALITDVLFDLANFDTTIGGRVGGTLPVFFPMDSSYIGNITITDESLADLGYLADISRFEFLTEASEVTALLANPDSLNSTDNSIVLNAADVIQGIKDFDFANQFNLFDNILMAVDGIDMFLEGLQYLLDTEIFSGLSLPVIGNPFTEGADFIEDFREDFIEPLRKLIEDVENAAKDVAKADKNLISKYMFDLLDALGLLQSIDSTRATALEAHDDFQGYFVTSPGKNIGLTTNFGDYLDGVGGVTFDETFIQWDLAIGGEYEFGKDFDFDIGIPGLGLEADGDVSIKIGWDLDIGFGISFKDGFYFNIADQNELTAHLIVDMDETTVVGTLGFLQLTADVNEADLGLAFEVNIKEKGESETSDDGKMLTFTELGKIDIGFGIAAEALIDLTAELGLSADVVGSGAASGFPNVSADFILDWGIYGPEGFDSENPEDSDFVTITELGNQLQNSLKYVGFQNITLDLGSFVSDVLGPIVGDVQDITEPIQPLIDFITTPFPVLSDFGLNITPLDLAAAYGQIDPGLIYAIADIITLINKIPDPDDVGSLKIPILDNLAIYDDGTSGYGNGSSNSFIDLGGAGGDLWSSDFDLSGAFDTVKGKVEEIFGSFLPGWLGDTLGDLAGEAADIMGDLTSEAANTNPWAFPIIEDPMQVLGLFMGRPAVLVTYDMAPLEFDFEFSQFFSIWGPLGVSINIEFGAKIDFAFGYDTLGIQEFVESGFRNPFLLFDGFYVSDTDLPTGDFGTDVPEIVLTGGLWAAAEINLGVARAGVGGGVFIEIEFDLYDPDRDGRVRIKEIIGNIYNEWEYGEPLLAPLAIFDVHGEITAKLFAFLKIDLFLFEIDKRWDLTPEVTILEFDIPFTRPPILATELKDGDLQINAGPYAAQRLNGNINDISEHFVIRQSGSGRVEVKAPGLWNDWQEYEISATDATIVFKGGEGDDTFEVEGVMDATTAFEIDGGVGNDTITLSASPGALGHAVIMGSEGDDVIHGSGGDDIIYGLKGNDTIYGGGGNDIIFGDDGRIGSESITAFFTPTEDGDDIIYGGGGDDIIFGSGGADTIYGDDDDTVSGGSDTDIIIGDGGKLEYTGSEDKTVANVDEIKGTQRDKFDPKGGDDLLIGGADTDIIYGGTGNDTIDGGAGNDELYGEEGYDIIYGGSNVDHIYGGEGGDTIFGERDGSLTPTGNPDPWDETDSPLTVAGDFIYGEAGRDTIYGDTNVDDGVEPGGADAIYGGGGYDMIDGDAGGDEIYGEGGPDTIYGGTGADTIDGGDGADVVFGDRGPDDLTAQAQTFDGAADVNPSTDIITISGKHGFLPGQTVKYTAGGGTVIEGLEEGETYYVIVESPTTLKLAASKIDANNGTAVDITNDGSGLEHKLTGVWNPKVYGTNTANEYDYLFGSTKSNDTPGGEDPGDLIYSGSGSDFLDGQAGNDTYVIYLEGASNNGFINLHDSRDESSETDYLQVFGTMYDDEFLLRKSSSLSGLSFVALINDEPYAERINYWGAGAVAGLGLERMLVTGSFGDDYFAVDDVGVDATLTGDVGEDRFQVGQLYNSARDECAYQYNHIEMEDVFATIETTVGWLSDGINRPMTIYGGENNDYFTVFHNKAVLSLFGEDGDDTFLIKAFALAGSQEPVRERTDVSGGAGVDLVQYAMNAPVNIDGGDGFDRVIIIGTEFGDDFVVTKDGVFGAGLNVNFVNIESLSVDGAEGDDRFYVLSTGEDLITELFGGLGSDTFNMSGPTPPIISNDLRGHSGVITHDIENIDTNYNETLLPGDETIIGGISAHVSDNDTAEPVIVINEPDGETVITEGDIIGAGDSYWIVLSKSPKTGEVVTVQVMAPVQTQDQEERKARMFQLSSPTEVLGSPTTDRTSISLEFDEFNWYIPQEVQVSAPDDGNASDNDTKIMGYLDPDDHDDDAIEGDKTGYITHMLTSSIAAVTGSPTSLPTVTELSDGSKVTTFIDMSALYTSSLVGYMLQITDGPGAGQSLRIKEVDGLHTLKLFGEFRGCEAAQVGPTSMYKITRDIEAVRAIEVLVHDNDIADVDLVESDHSTEIFEAGADDTIDIVLARQPDDESGTVDDVTVTLASNDGQLTFDDSELTFSAVGSDSNAWNDPQTVTVSAFDDSVREGFHHGLISFTLSSDDVDDDESVTESPALNMTQAYVGLLNRPVIAAKGMATSASAEGTFVLTDTNASFSGVDGYLVQITGGTGKGQTRSIASSTATSLTVTMAWDEALDDTSQYEVVGVTEVRIGGLARDVNLYQVVSNKVVFINEDGEYEFIASGTAVQVDYTYVDRGYNLLEVKPKLTDIADDDVPQVKITETGDGTDVIEDGLYVGKVTSWTIDTLTDSSASFGSISGLLVQITEGAGKGQVRTIDSVNPAGDTLTVTKPWDTSLVTVGDNASEYAVLFPAHLENPFWDTYEVVLTQEPTGDVEVLVTPEITKTSAGRIIHWGKQVGVMSLFNPNAVDNGDGTITLKFTDSNWASPQTVFVIAVDDTHYDGDDTQVFAPQPHTVSDIQGPLYLYGAGGYGSIVAFKPLMLDHELNIMPSTGNVNSVGGDGTTITVDKVPLFLGAKEINKTIRDLIDDSAVDAEVLEAIVAEMMTVTISEGTVGTEPDGDPIYIEEIGQFRLIVDAVDNGTTVTLTLNEAWDIADGETFDMIEKYRITQMSPNFFADETEQIDYLFVYNEDSPADNEIPSREGWLTDSTTIGYAGNSIIEDFVTNQDGKWLRGLGMAAEDLMLGGVMHPRGITYGDMEVVEINLGDGRDHFTVEDTHIRADGFQTWTIINTGDEPVGDYNEDGIEDGDLIAVSLHADDVLDLHTGTVTDAGANSLTDDTGGGSFPLTANEKGLSGYIVEITGGTGVGQRRVITSNTATELTIAEAWGIIPDTDSEYRVFGAELVTGTATGVAAPTGNTLNGDFSSFLVNELQGKVIEIIDGSGAGIKREIIANTATELTVSSTWNASLDTTTVYRVYGDQDGPVSINTQGGADRLFAAGSYYDEINDTTVVLEDSTLPLIIFGGAGDDEIVGGLADDIIFGDRGRVDFVDENFVDGNGKIVTLLGLVREVIDPRYVTGGGAEGGNTLIDTAAIFPVESIDAPGLTGLMVSITDGAGFRHDPHLITGNTADTLTVAPVWETALNPDPGGPFDPSDPDNNPSKYRISLIPEDQTDGVVRDPSRLIAIDETIGGDDVITGNEGNDRIFGGLGDDEIQGNNDNDIIFGDHGRMDYEPETVGDVEDGPVLGDSVPATLERIRTTFDAIGGSDTITGDAGDDIILGGYDDSYTDILDGNTDDDILIGDNGVMAFVPNDDTLEDPRDVYLDDINTLSHGIGGTDIISGNEGYDIAIGGTDDDTIYGDDALASAGALDGEDIIIGDNGHIDFTPGVTGRFNAFGGGVNLIETTDVLNTTGGGDTIEGNAQADVILGGVNDGEIDEIYGDAATPGVNDDDDVILGDNGQLDFAYGDSDITTLDILRSLPYDDPDTPSVILGGVDSISGDAGNDTIIGGVDGDTIHGDDVAANNGAADGKDILIGDNGEIFLSGDVPATLYVLDSGINLIQTTDDEEATGGGDFIEGNAGNDVILGGVNNGEVDVLHGDATAPSIHDGEDILIGDNGEVDYDVDGAGLTTLDLITTNTYASDEMTVLGGRDRIFGNAYDDVALGGSADDDIIGDNYETDPVGAPGVVDGLSDSPGDDTIIGDQGHVVYVNGLVTLIETLDLQETDGGSDYVQGNDLEDIILGGVEGDILIGESETTDRVGTPGDDIIIGDEGRLRYDVALSDAIYGAGDEDPNTLDLIETFDTGVLGGDDIVYGNGESDIVMGGSADDDIFGDFYAELSATDEVIPDTLDAAPSPGMDVLIGDGGQMTFFDDAVTVIRTIEPSMGGSDHIEGHDLTDKILGGVDDDELYGESPETDLPLILSGAGDDWMLGDNGRFDYVLASDNIEDRHDVAAYLGGTLVELDPDSSTLDIVTTTDVNDGGNDVMYGNGGNDVMFGGTATDTMRGDTTDNEADSNPDGADGIDLMFGDHAKIFPTLPTVDDFFVNNNFFSINTQVEDDGFDDIMFGNGNDDIMIGGQGDDIMFGGNGDDDMIGGFNVTNGDDELDTMPGVDQLAISPNVLADLNAADVNEINDIMDGGADDDVMTGDNAYIIRQPGGSVLLADALLSPRFRVLNESGLLYVIDSEKVGGLADIDVGFHANVTADYQSHQDMTLVRTVYLYNHDEATEDAAVANPGDPRPFGNDVIAGGTEDDEIWGQLGDDIIQGDGQIKMLVKPAEFKEFNPAQNAIPDFGIRDAEVLDTLASGIDTTFQFSAFEDIGDGDDYIEGNGGNDRIYGGLGQDDLIGGSSILFGLDGPVTNRPDGADLIYGGAGNPALLSRNASFTGPDNDVSGNTVVPEAERHARDADVILGDNGEIYRIVREDPDTQVIGYEAFNYDYDATTANGFIDDGYNGDALMIIPRAVDLNDYGYNYADTDADPSTRDALTFTSDVRGEGDLIYGESGDDVIHGMTGNDAIFGNSEHDDLYGEIGTDFLLGGTGIDGILGDDGLILTRRNDLNAEPLYGIDPRDPEQVKVKNNEEVNTNALNAEISTPGNIQRAIINIEGELVKVLETFVFRTDDLDGQSLGEFDDSMWFNDIIFGGLDNDFIHGIDGDDAISGAEALPVYYSGAGYGFEDVNTFLQNMQSAPPNGTPDLADNPFWFGFAPYNPGEILRYEGKTIVDGNGQNPKTRDEFAWYDEFNPRRKIMFDFDYNFDTLPGEDFVPLATETGVDNTINFLLNFNEDEGPLGYHYLGDENAMNTDGNDRIFGDVGHDWLVGGTGRDNMYGGRGNDLLNMDDNHDSGPGGRVGPHDPLPDPLDNTQSDEFQAYADIVYAGAGRDIMILNTGADRSLDWVGEFNSYIVPFSPFGAFHISRNLSPHVPEYLQALSASDGADVRVDPGKLNNVPDAQLYVDQKNIDVRIDEPDPLRNYEPYGELGMVRQQDLDWGPQTGAPNDPQPGNLQGKRDIMRRELFQDTVVPKGAFAETEGIWTASDGKLEAAPVILGEDAVSIYHLDKMQPSYMEILVTINAEKDKAGFKSNAYIIFDYKSSTDFKFAGVDVGIDKIQIGHYTADGWIVDSQIPRRLKAGIDYDLTLVMYGTVATIWVDGNTSLSFDFNDALNDDGLIGLATNNAVARFDDWQVQKLPPTLTFQFTEDFTGTSSNPFEDQTGNWMIADGHYSGSVLDGDRAITTWALEVATWSLLELEALINTDSTGGLIFDYYDTDNFKFAAIDALNDQVVIGHHTSKGWYIDASVERVIEPGTSYTLGISMLGTSVSVTLDGEAVLGHVFNSLLNDGDLGLLSKDGLSSFDYVVAQGDDPAYAEESDDALMAASLGDATDITELNHTELAPIIDAAFDYWVNIAGMDASLLADVSFLITDLSDMFLAVTVGNTILIDIDAAGNGWFVDETPYDNIEFGSDDGNGELTATLSSEAEDLMDLLTVVTHELGHVLGLEDVDAEEQDLMSDTLATGVRRVYAEAVITTEPLDDWMLDSMLLLAQ